MSQTSKSKTVIVKKEEQRQVEANKETIKEGKDTVKKADDLIDKIDDILEENAEQFVKNYIQKGGE